MTATPSEVAGRELVAVYLSGEDDVLEARAETLTHPRLRPRMAASDLVAALPAMLAALGWRGGARRLLDLLPEGPQPFGLDDLCRVLRRAGFETTVRRARRLSNADAGSPRLVAAPSSPAVVALGTRGDRLVVYDPALGRTRLAPPGAYQNAWLVEAQPSGADETLPAGWLARRFRSLRPVAGLALAFSLAINLLGLGVPLFAMAVFDLVVGHASVGFLHVLTMGIAAALALELMLRWMRRQLLTRAGAELSHTLSTAAFAKLLSLPLAAVERIETRSQMARMKDIDQIRAAVSGPLALAVLELPFAGLAVMVVALVAGAVALVPVAALAACVAIGLPLSSWVNGRQVAASRASARRQELALEAIREMRALRVAGAEGRWLDRYEALSREAASASTGATFAASALSTFGHALGTLTALGVIAAGAWSVASGNLSGGGMIAAMMLSWRVVSSVQGGLGALMRLRAVTASARAVEALMGAESEIADHEGRTPWLALDGAVAFRDVSFRHAGAPAPALRNVSFAVEPGELVTVAGAGGAGKTTLLEIVAGLREPQLGRVLVDGHDMRQFHPAVLRGQISFLPEPAPLFAGTLRDNLRLVSPGASDDELRRALELAGAGEHVRGLSHGLDTWVDGRAPSQFHASLLPRLALARALLKQAPIVVLDEPVDGLDFEGEFDFMAALERLRGASTVFLASHRPSHVRAADKVLLMDAGRVRCLGREAAQAALEGTEGS